jgi:hypothetical protein
MRVEGEWWVAYYAMPDTMDNALELSRVRRTIVGDPRRRDAYLVYIREAVGDYVEEVAGVRPVWEEI